jgi:hypothetical protein
MPDVVAHAYNPSYSGGRDQEDHILKPAWANSPRDPIEKPNTKKGLTVVQVIEYLSSKCEAQIPNASTRKKNREKCVTFRG